MPCRRPVWLGDALALYASQPSLSPQKSQEKASRLNGAAVSEEMCLKKETETESHACTCWLVVPAQLGLFVLHACLLARGPCCLCTFKASACAGFLAAIFLILPAPGPAAL